LPIGTADLTSYTDTTVSIGNTYYYRISSLKNNVESEKSATVVSARAEMIFLLPPEGLTVTEQTVSSISLSWAAVPEAVQYKVYKGRSADAVTEYVTTVSSTSHTVDGLTANTVYYFTVSSLNETGESSPSAAVQGVTSAIPPLQAPTGLGVTGQTQNSISLSWTAVSGAAGYKVYRSSTGSEGSYGTGVAVASTSYTDTGLAASTSYYYRVTAYNDQGESAAASVSGTTASNDGTSQLPPPKPTGLVVSGASSGSVSLSWSGVSTANSYEVWRGNSKDGASAKIGTVTETSYTDYTVGAGAAYYYAVRAANASGSSPTSDRAFAYAAQHYELPVYTGSYPLNLSPGEKHYYRLAVTKGQGYTITWQNGNNQNRDYYIRCSAWQNDGTEIFNNANNGYTSPKVFTATMPGYVTVEVRNAHSVSLDYQIYY
jgi:fibronectin type 3 domain-containing protein